MWKRLEQRQSRAVLGTSPRKTLEGLDRIQSIDVVLPVADQPGREVWPRCGVRPDKAQSMLLERLGLKLPER